MAMKTRVILTAKQSRMLQIMQHQPDTVDVLPEHLAADKKFVTMFETLCGKLESTEEVSITAALNVLVELPETAPTVPVDELLTKLILSAENGEVNNTDFASAPTVPSHTNKPMSESKQNILENLRAAVLRDVRIIKKDELFTVTNSGTLRQKVSDVRESVKLIFDFFSDGDIITRVDLYACLSVKYDSPKKISKQINSMCAVGYLKSHENCDENNINVETESHESAPPQLGLGI